MLQIVHISDIHFDGARPELAKKMIKKLGDDIPTQLDTKADKIILLFTGDLVQAGSSEVPYNEFYSCLEEMVISKLKSYNVTIACVPGNHDIDRNYIIENAPMIKGISDNLKDLISLNDFLDRSPDSLTLPMKNYTNFENGFANYGACQNSFFGSGYDLGNGVGLYCLNSAWNSFGGHSIEGRKNDRSSLLASTRQIHQWINDNPQIKYRIIAMHHPLDWFRIDVFDELSKLVDVNFGLYLYGHMHRPKPIVQSSPTSDCFHCQSGALSSKEPEHLFYQIFNICPNEDSTEVKVRHFSDLRQLFVSGSLITGTDCGTFKFENVWQSKNSRLYRFPLKKYEEYLERLLSSHPTSNGSIYVAPSITDRPYDVSNPKEKLKHLSVASLVQQNKNLAISTPKSFGGTALAVEICIEFCRQGKMACLLNALETPRYLSKFDDFLRLKKTSFAIQEDLKCDVFVIDDYDPSKNKHTKFLRMLETKYADTLIVLLHKTNPDDPQNERGIDRSAYNCFYLNALNRSKVRTIVSQFTQRHPDIDEEEAVKLVSDNMQRLNLHRVPQNVIMFLELINENPNFAPVNRSEFVYRYFEIMFRRHHEPIGYEESLDFQDKIHLLTNIAASLYEADAYIFDREYWQKYCVEYQGKFGKVFDAHVELDLFVQAQIFENEDRFYRFRFSMWTWYFVANQMINDDDFCELILDSQKYQAYPEVIEFASGITRNETDILLTIEGHLKDAILEFEKESKLDDNFEPYSSLVLGEDDENQEKFHKALITQVLGSNIDVSVKDQILDKNYDYEAPYQQKVSAYINNQALGKVYATFQALGLCLRNSEHVERKIRIAVTLTFFKAIERFSQAAFLALPEIVKRGYCSVSGMCFLAPDAVNGDPKQSTLDLIYHLPGRMASTVDQYMGSDKFWRTLNYDEDIGLSAFTQFLNIGVLIRHKISGWDKIIEKYMVGLDKNSIFLDLTLSALSSDRYLGGSLDQNTADTEKLIAVAILRQKGVKKPSKEAIENLLANTTFS